MRIGGALLSVFVLVSCGPAAASSGSRVVTSGDVGAPEGGNANGGERSVLVADDADPEVEAPSSTSAEIVVSGRGFTPQPVVRTGTAGGTVAGSTFSMDCVGHYPPRPQHVVKLNGPIDLLRILAATASGDLTLAVRTPDGVFHCDDDSGDPSNGLNPTVELYAPPAGTIEVFVGTYSTYDSGLTYQLGVTEQSGYASDVVSR